ncbi:hypothetical protein O9929_13805 [Vibrio lentus]|nr:hypothetical protein [Vibrio lentus]
MGLYSHDSVDEVREAVDFVVTTQNKQITYKVSNCKVLMAKHESLLDKVVVCSSVSALELPLAIFLGQITALVAGNTVVAKLPSKQA